MKLSLGLIVAIAIILGPNVTYAGRDFEAERQKITTFDLTGKTISSFNTYELKERADGSVVTADLGTDGINEIIFGSGHAMKPMVRLYRQDGTKISEFVPYVDTMNFGVNVAACDLDGNGDTEIITAPGFGGSAKIKIFDHVGATLSEGFYAFGESFKGGVSIACGDVNGDGMDDIVTGAGVTGGPHVRVWKSDGTMLGEIFAGSATDSGGVNVGIADLDNNGDSELLAVRAGVGDATVLMIDWKKNKLTTAGSIPTWNDRSVGARVFGVDIDADLREEIAVTSNGAGTPEVRVYSSLGLLQKTIQPYGVSEGALIATALKTTDGTRILAMKTPEIIKNEPGQYIRIDLSDQQLSAYQDGVFMKATLVSTGKGGYSTPQARTTVAKKILWKDYVWNYGVGNPNNYNLPGVKYNLQFRPHMYIHSAYWHNNFGNVMSHGCINTPYADVEWVYNWANVGAVVDVVK